MTELLIPFGIHCDTGAIVEPEDAPSGRACNCLCPGCKAPLISRHPAIKRIHFAHDSRLRHAKPEEDCPFSSAVAVAMMVREIAPMAIGKALRTPSLTLPQRFECCGEHQDIAITMAATNTIDQARSSVKILDRNVDVVLEIRGHRVLVDLVYSGKPSLALEEEQLKATNAAVLELDCDSFSLSSLTADRSLRFSDSVMIFLLQDGARHWRFHPKSPAAVRKAIEAHQCSMKNFRNSSASPKNYQCALCRTQWMQESSVNLLCPNGHSHLFAKEL